MERLHYQPEPELLPVQPNVMKEGDEGLERAALTDGSLQRVEST